MLKTNLLATNTSDHQNIFVRIPAFTKKFEKLITGESDTPTLRGAFRKARFCNGLCDDIA
jgi:hypothetical protein